MPGTLRDGGVDDPRRDELIVRAKGGGGDEAHGGVDYH